MPDAPASKKGFDIGHPGFKEYAIVISLALGGFLLVSWYRNRTGGAAASSGTQSPVAVLQGPGPGAAALWLAIQDLAGQKTTTTTSTTGGGGGDKNIVLQKNRTLASLAKEYGVSVKVLEDLNPDLPTSGQIKAGQKVRVPASVAAARRGG